VRRAEVAPGRPAPDGGPRAEALRALLLETFPALTPERVADAALDATPGWDSLGHLQLMMAVEARFGIEIPTDAMLQASDFGAILALLPQPSGEWSE
jgi:acyl carrier protein